MPDRPVTLSCSDQCPFSHQCGTLVARNAEPCVSRIKIEVLPEIASKKLEARPLDEVQVKNQLNGVIIATVNRGKIIYQAT